MKPSAVKTFILLSSVYAVVMTSGCATMHVAEDGSWDEPVPQNISVKEAARVERPWYAKGVTPFFVSILGGSRAGLEWNEGRNVRATELVRGLPFVGIVMIPLFCYEALTEQTMQQKANETGIDKHRQAKYEAIIKRLQNEGRSEEAQYLAANTPFDPAHHPADPRNKIPQEKLDGFSGNTQIIAVDILVGHRNSLERIEGRHLRKMEYFAPLILPRIWESFEAAFGRKMEDVAEQENLDRPWVTNNQAGLPAPGQPVSHPQIISPGLDSSKNFIDERMDKRNAEDEKSLEYHQLRFVRLDGVPNRGIH